MTTFRPLGQRQPKTDTSTAKFTFPENQDEKKVPGFIDDLPDLLELAVRRLLELVERELKRLDLTHDGA